MAYKIRFEMTAGSCFTQNVVWTESIVHIRWMRFTTEWRVKTICGWFEKKNAIYPIEILRKCVHE